MARKTRVAAKKRPKISALVFCRLYMESWSLTHSYEEFADRIGLPVPLCRSRVANYRKRGWNAPNLRRRTRELAEERKAPIAEMNRLTQEFISRQELPFSDPPGVGVPKSGEVAAWAAPAW